MEKIKLTNNKLKDDLGKLLEEKRWKYILL